MGSRMAANTTMTKNTFRFIETSSNLNFALGSLSCGWAITGQGGRNFADVGCLLEGADDLNNRFRLCGRPLRKLSTAAELVGFVFVAHRIGGMPFCELRAA